MTLRNLGVGAIFLIVALTPVVAQTSASAPGSPPQGAPTSIASQDPSLWLGLTPPGAYAAKGAPAEVSALAVDEKRWQVVHFYLDHSYLFWTSNRVWQVRLDKLWTGTIRGVAMGAARTDVETAWGQPLARGDTWSLWNLPYQTFPRRVRLVFTDGVLTDAYLYRSDL